MKRLIGLSILLLITAGCASAPPVLSEAERSVRILRDTEPPMTCRDLGRVEVRDNWGHDVEALEAELKRKAYALSGNVVQRRVVALGFMSGVAFKCPGTP